MTLSTTSIEGSSPVTLMSADIERIAQGFKSVHEIWANTIEVSVALYLLYLQIGIDFITTLIIILGRHETTQRAARQDLSFRLTASNSELCGSVCRWCTSRKGPGYLDASNADPPGRNKPYNRLNEIDQDEWA